jgi:hypothetical protein
MEVVDTLCAYDRDPDGLLAKGALETVRQQLRFRTLRGSLFFAPLPFWETVLLDDNAEHF